MTNSVDLSKFETITVIIPQRAAHPQPALGGMFVCKHTNGAVNHNLTRNAELTLGGCDLRYDMTVGTYHLRTTVWVSTTLEELQTLPDFDAQYFAVRVIENALCLYYDPAGLMRLSGGI